MGIIITKLQLEFYAFNFTLCIRIVMYNTIFVALKINEKHFTYDIGIYIICMQN